MIIALDSVVIVGRVIPLVTLTGRVVSFGGKIDAVVVVSGALVVFAGLVVSEAVVVSGAGVVVAVVALVVA